MRKTLRTVNTYLAINMYPSPATILIYTLIGLAIALVGLYAFNFHREKTAISTCSVHAAEFVKTNARSAGDLSANDGDTLFDVAFKACMGKRGYER